jgi:hypothetical protein
VHAYEALAQEARQPAPEAPPLALTAAHASRTEEIFAAVDRALDVPRDSAAVARLSRALATWLSAVAARAPDEPAALALRRALHETPAARGVDALAGRQRVRRLAAAAQSWTRFLHEGGSGARFAGPARQNLAGLAARMPSD